MPFDDAQYERPALSGDVGVGLLTTEFALRKLMEIIGVLAEKAQVDVSAELREVDAMTTQLRKSFEHIAGWREP